MSIKLTPTITLYEREDWNARHWRDRVVQAKPTEGFVHHSTDRLAEHARTLAEQKAMARAIQNYHMDTNGWSDIGYHYLVFQAYGTLKYARIFEGRPVKHVPAAQAFHNTGTVAVCVVGNFQGDDTVKDNTRYAIGRVLAAIPSLDVLGGHRDVVATSCPGDTLYRQVPQIAKNAGLQVYRQRMTMYETMGPGPDKYEWAGDPDTFRR